MNLYKYPSAQSELVLASAWAKSARREGHRPAIPASPQENTGGVKRGITEDECGAVLLSMATGRQFAGEISKHTGLGHAITSRALKSLVAGGKVTAAPFVTRVKRPDVKSTMRRTVIFSLVQS